MEEVADAESDVVVLGDDDANDGDARQQSSSLQVPERKTADQVWHGLSPGMKSSPGKSRLTLIQVVVALTNIDMLDTVGEIVHVQFTITVTHTMADGTFYTLYIGSAK